MVNSDIERVWSCHSQKTLAAYVVQIHGLQQYRLYGCWHEYHVGLGCSHMKAY